MHLQATTNMSSSPVCTNPRIFQAPTNMSFSHLHQYIHQVFHVSSGHNKYVLQLITSKVFVVAWRLIKWLVHTLMQRAGGHICCGLLKTLDVVCYGLEDIFVVKIVHTCIDTFTGTRNKDVLKPQLRDKTCTLHICLSICWSPIHSLYCMA